MLISLQKQKLENKIADAEGKIHYTADFDGSKEWLENNLKKEETITFKADVAGVTQDIQAYFWCT